MIFSQFVTNRTYEKPLKRQKTVRNHLNASVLILFQWHFQQLCIHLLPLFQWTLHKRHWLILRLSTNVTDRMTDHKTFKFSRFNNFSNLMFSFKFLTKFSYFSMIFNFAFLVFVDTNADHLQRPLSIKVFL